MRNRIARSGAAWLRLRGTRRGVARIGIAQNLRYAAAQNNQPVEDAFLLANCSNPLCYDSWRRHGMYLCSAPLASDSTAVANRQTRRQEAEPRAMRAFVPVKGVLTFRIFDEPFPFHGL